MTIKCGGCGDAFEPKTARARYCSTTCRSRAARARKAAAASAESEAKTGTPAEHGLVRAVRLELEAAEAVETVAGQLALQVARRIVEPEASGVSTLSKELRSLLAEAKGESGPPPDGGDGAAGEAELEEDEVTKARRQREEARQAAGLA